MGKRRGLLFALLILAAVLLALGIIQNLRQWGRFRPTMRDAVFVSRIENTSRKGEDIEAEKNAGAARV